MSEKLVLDSFALVALFHKEPGWQGVQAAFYEQEKARTQALLKSYSPTIRSSEPSSNSSRSGG
ncbi:MAG: hypothetical protein K8F29_02900 [Kofleriaceae bacterium]|nr:hypothetical protein [Candidatus Methylomirabilis lanthanidiphila]